MSDYYGDSHYHVPPIPESERSRTEWDQLKDSSGSVQNAILKAYAWMFAGLLLTAAVSFISAATGLTSLITRNMVIPFLLVIAQFVLVWVFTSAMRDADASRLKVMFLGYAALMGLSLSTIFYAYRISELFLAFLISAVFYGCLVIVGYTTKRDMTKIGSICLAGLFALIVGGILCLFFGNYNILLFSVIGLVLFIGITIWDVQRLNQTMLATEGLPMEQEKWAIYFALELYLDFLNVFLYILRLIGRNSSRK